jgi:hypothetical protein
MQPLLEQVEHCTLFDSFWSVKCSSKGRERVTCTVTATADWRTKRNKSLTHTVGSLASSARFFNGPLPTYDLHTVVFYEHQTAQTQTVLEAEAASNPTQTSNRYTNPRKSEINP